MGRYEAILKTAELGNITKAAEELGYTQASLSRVIQRMEDDFQCILFHRARRGVMPTDVGSKMIDVMQKIEELENELYLIAMANRTHMLRVSTVYSISSTILAECLTQYYQKYPDSVVTIPEFSTWTEIENSVKSGDVDIAFYGGTYYAGYEFIPLYKDPYYAVVSTKHPLASKEIISTQEMALYDVILPSEGTSNAIIRNLVREMHITPNLIPKLEHDRATVALVEANLGISILPGLALRNIHRDIKVIPLKENPVRDVGILCRSYYELSDQAKAFIRITKNILDKLPPLL